MPNILTIIRLISPIFYLLTMLLLEDYAAEKNIILSLFIFLSITDFFDGYIARKFNITSNFGKVFDPISDKILVIITLIYLSTSDVNILYPTLLIVLREFLISGLREYSIQISGNAISVTYLSKLKTALQFISIISFFLNDILLYKFDLNIYLYSYITLWIATLLTLYTGCKYCINAFKK